jgi:DNA mismatch repair protein MutS
MDLYEKKASYIFATHFHEIVQYDEIKSMENMSLKHMSVIYDHDKDCLIYDRKLRDGPGTKTYGLEVCKSLYLPEEFLKKAYSIRNKYFPETRGELSQLSSRYNSSKIKGVCEICKENMGEEIHHLQQQKEADDKGYIGGFHKNHPANLVSVCHKCHYTLHNGEQVSVVKTKKKTTKGYGLI